jgi:sorting nexin-9/18/33
MAKVQEASSKIQEAGKMTESDLQSVQSRADVITYTVLAEMQHFQKHRVADFKTYVTNYLQGQINFYKAVSALDCFIVSVRPVRGSAGFH